MAPVGMQADVGTDFVMRTTQTRCFWNSVILNTLNWFVYSALRVAISFVESGRVLTFVEFTIKRIFGKEEKTAFIVYH